MNKSLIFLILLLPLRVWGEEVILPNLSSLEVSSDTLGEIYRTNSVSLSGLSVDDQAGLAEHLAGWIGKPLTTTSLDGLTEAILNHYEENDRPMNDVTVPPQEGDFGRLIIKVTEGRVGTVGINRTRHFNDDLLQNSITLNSGDLLRSSEIDAQIDWLNRNPFRKTHYLVSPGENVTADLLFEVRETKPWQVSTEYANSGVEAVGKNRWSAGFVWGNAFNRDHLLSYRLSSGDSLDEFTAHSLSWEIPLHEKHHWLSFSAGYAEVQARNQFAGLATESDSTSWQLALTYGMTLPRLHDWKQELRFGAEFKRAENFVLLGETTIPDRDIDVFQLRADWSVNGPLWSGQASANVSAIFSPGGVGSGNSSDAFSSYRSSAEPTYFYAKFAGRWQRELFHNWELQFRGEGQLASGALVPTEQLGLGGVRTIRGYDEQSFLADSGYALSFELHTPPWTLGNGNKLHALTFLDHGWGWRENEGSSPFTSVGLGLRFRHQNHLTTRLDFGQTMTAERDTAIHASVSFSF